MMYDNEFWQGLRETVEHDTRIRRAAMTPGERYRDIRREKGMTYHPRTLAALNTLAARLTEGR